jgi:hypothetical protein
MAGVNPLFHFDEQVFPIVGVLIVNAAPLR